MTPRRMATPRPVTMPLRMQRRNQALPLDDRRPRYEANPSLSSCLSTIGAFLFLVAFTVGVLVVGPLVGLAIAGGRP